MNYVLKRGKVYEEGVLITEDPEEVRSIYRSLREELEELRRNQRLLIIREKSFENALKSMDPFDEEYSKYESAWMDLQDKIEEGSRLINEKRYRLDESYMLFHS